MTAIPQPRHTLLSGRIIDPLREIVRRHWLVRATVGVIQTLIAGLTVLLVAALLLGYFEHLWMSLRVALAAIAWAAVLAAAIHLLRPVIRKWNLSLAAQHVERHRPDFQERLSSAVELADERDPHFRGSPSLIDHLVRQAEADAGAVKPDQFIRTDRIIRWSIGLVPVLAAWLLITL